LLVDPQNTFCLPEFELFVGGPSGQGAIEDTIRLCEFIYHHLDRVTQIVVTMDTHQIVQIFHPIFWIDGKGEHPEPMTEIGARDVERGIWRVNPALADYRSLQDRALHYTRELEKNGRYRLTVWPYHSLLGGIGHAIVSSLEEAIFFHAIARQSQPHFEIKGRDPLTENYSALRPEVVGNDPGETVARENTPLLKRLLAFDRVLVAGQAKSHCVAWTVEDLWQSSIPHDPEFVKKIVLLEDCSSPVVIRGAIDFTERAATAYRRFAAAGMRVTGSVDLFPSAW
jgi:nicotinamidase-related amidase